MSPDAQLPPVRKSIVVRATPQQAFEIFTEDFDGWWPRTHHVGSTPMASSLIECKLGGRCYSKHIDGSECDWGQVLAWDPPHRLVIAWQITGAWKHEPSLEKSSEVEVHFAEQPDGTTLVSLEHRHLDRGGPSASAMRTAIDSPNGWSGILRLFGARVEQRDELSPNSHTGHT